VVRWEQVVRQKQALVVRQEQALAAVRQGAIRQDATRSEGRRLVDQPATATLTLRMAVFLPRANGGATRRDGEVTRITPASCSP